MVTLAEPQSDVAARSMGHVAIHYANKEEGPIAARLMRLLGYVETQAFPLPDGSMFYRFVVADLHTPRGDGIIYLSAVPEPQRALVAAAREALGYGTDDEHPAIAAFRAGLEADPEMTFHLGVLVESLEELERLTTQLTELGESDPDFKGRIKVKVNRPRRGDEAIDARLDASEAFGKVDRYAYGRNGVQLFVETDILSSGPLGESLVLEFDYVFPGATSHILSVVEL